jgi:hypothetical protein
MIDAEDAPLADKREREGSRKGLVVWESEWKERWRKRGEGRTSLKDQ